MYLINALRNQTNGCFVLKGVSYILSEKEKAYLFSWDTTPLIEGDKLYLIYKR